jgi:pimeloyl-ACP methyl ester carboxylesterase
MASEEKMVPAAYLRGRRHSPESARRRRAARWKRACTSASVTVVLGALLLVSAPGTALADWSSMQLPVPPNLPRPPVSGYAPANGVRVWYGVFGTGRPVILLEGGEDPADDWSMLVPVLVSHGYRAVVIDTRCQGRSTCSPQTLDYHLFAEDMIAAMNHLDIHRAAIVGFSDGGIIGLDLAMHHPDRITRVFAYGADSSPAGEIFSVPKDPVAAAHSKASDRWCRARYHVESPTPDAWPQLDARVQRMWKTKPNYTPGDLRAIRVPVWIADGDREAYIKRSDTDMMAQTIPGASELIFPDADHYAMWENPALFNQAVLSFLAPSDD